jgi:hypothetical protein
MYSFRTSIYRGNGWDGWDGWDGRDGGNGGIEHIYHEERDDERGQKKTIETRRIGKQSMTHQRIEKANGEVEEEESRKNIEDKEVEEFQKHWESYGFSNSKIGKYWKKQSIEMKRKQDEKEEEGKHRNEEFEGESKKIDEIEDNIKPKSK